MNRQLHIMVSLCRSASITIAFVTLLTIVADLNPPLKDWLKAVFSHHWIAKGVLAAILFFVLSTALSAIEPSRRKIQVDTSVMAVAWTTVLGTAVLLLFFLYETFLKV